MVGFVGPNGAGKTTAMRIALGVLEADGGEVRWRGRVVDGTARRRFGYIPEERGLYPKMRASFLISVGALEDPDSTIARVASLLPFSSALAMPVRMVLDSATPWEIAASLAIVIGSTALLIPLAGRVYAGAVLRTGAKVKLRDAWRAAV